MFCLTDTKVFVKFLRLNIFVLTKTQQLIFINSHLGWCMNLSTELQNVETITHNHRRKDEPQQNNAGDYTHRRPIC